MLGAALGWAALMVAANSIQAQETNTVGNPQLKDFELPGSRTVPPPVQQQPEPATTPPATTAPPVTAPPPASTVPSDRSAPPPAAAEPRAAVPRPRPAARAAAPASSVSEPAAVPVLAPVDVPAAPALEQPLPAPTSETAPPATAPAPTAEPQRSFHWLYLGAAAVLALLALGALFVFRRSRASAADGVRPEEAPEQPQAAAGPDPLFARPPAPPTPVPVPAPPLAVAPVLPSAQAGGIVGVSIRPRLELEFKPDRAAATLTDTSVQFELTIRNTGNRTARDIRIQVQMVNAGPDQDSEIGAFFAQPLSREVPPAVASILPGSDVQIKTGVTLPKDRIREITIQGRRLFIPVVAFNVFYEWDQGRVGQTSMSYLVGREAASPQEKMGAFRLDLGPRLYRSVGQRQGHLAKVV